MSLGLEKAGMTTAAFCEIKPYCQKILRKHWSEVPIYDDIRKLKKSKLKRDGIKTIDLITGGFPCQPYSLAGKQRGAEDDRDLWPEMCRIIKEWKPTWVIGENVANFTNMAFARCKLDLENLGYTVQPFIIPACAIGTLHRRDRVWIIAHLGGNGSQRGNKKPLSWQSPFSWLENVGGIEDLRKRSALYSPMLCRANDGIPYWVERLEAIGNAVQTQIPEIIGKAIMKIEGSQ